VFRAIGIIVGAGFKPALKGNRIKKWAGLKPAPTNLCKHRLPEIVRALKTFSSRKINQISKRTGQSIWQRGYYEHVIRTDESRDRIRRYIVNNPLSWHLDRENIKRTGDDDLDKYFREQRM
jgi:hypothetical protein